MTDLVFERRIAARPATVYSYFTDEEKYTEWMGTDATLDPVPGGGFRVVNPDGAITSGRYVELDPPHRLVFTWGFEGDPAVPPGSTRVTVTLDPDGDGTLLRLIHSELPDGPWADKHREGWAKFLPRLSEAVLR